MHRVLPSCSILILLSVAAFSQEYTEEDIQKRHTTPYHLRSYPRVTSNSHYRYRPELSPNNVIDGQRTFGRYWRPARRTDLWLMVEFGREVQTEQVVIVLHRHDGQDKTWTGATLEFSNGEKVPVELSSTTQPQDFTFPKQKCWWVKLVDFRQCFPLVDDGIAEFEVHGKDL